MKKQPSPDLLPLTLTEQLAAERTKLANERTLLAYGRAALGLIVSGTGFGQYLDSPLLRTIFISFIPLGIVLLGVGIVRYRRHHRVLRRYQ